MQESKKSMMLEQEVSNLRKSAQDHQIELDFQVCENQRVKDLLKQLERGNKPECKDGTVQCELALPSHEARTPPQSTADSPAQTETAAQKPAETQTTLKINEICEFDKVLSDNKSLTAKLAK